MHVAPEPAELIELTQAWHGDRLTDGRSRVPDAVLARLRDVTSEQAAKRLLGLAPRTLEGG